MSEIHLPVRYNRDTEHLFDAHDYFLADFSCGINNAGAYARANAVGHQIEQMLNEHATLTARVAELEQENAKLLDEVTARRFTDERTDKLLDELEAENKRLREALEEIQGYGEVEVNPQHDWDVGNDLNACVRIARKALANKAE